MTPVSSSRKSSSVADLSKMFQSGDWHSSLVEDVNRLWQENPNTNTLTLLLNIQQSIRGFTPDELEPLLKAANQNSQLLSPSTALRLRAVISRTEEQFEGYSPPLRFHNLSSFMEKLRTRYLLSGYPTLLKQHRGLRHTQQAEGFCQRLCDWKAFTQTLEPGHVAVVGNAATELGRRHGNKIDQATHVFRFNNVKTEAHFAEDYGKKTTAWVISPAFRPDPGKLPARTVLISGVDPFYKPTKYWRHLATLPLDKIVTFPNHIWYQLVASLEAPPTAGLLTLASLIDADRHTAGMSVYGMSRELIKDEQNHYGDDGSKSARHNWQMEALLANKLIRKVEQNAAEESCQAANQKSS